MDFQESLASLYENCSSWSRLSIESCRQSAMEDPAILLGELNDSDGRGIDARGDEFRHGSDGGRDGDGAVGCGGFGEEEHGEPGPGVGAEIEEGTAGESGRDHAVACVLRVRLEIDREVGCDGAHLSNDSAREDLLHFVRDGLETKPDLREIVSRGYETS